MIGILVPALHRPNRVAPLVENFGQNCPEDSELIFITTPNDMRQLKQVQAACETHPRCRHISSGRSAGPGDYAFKIQRGYEAAESEWIFTGADDLRFHPGWAEAALAAHRRRGARVIGTQDLCNPSVKKGNHSTHTLIHTSYIEEQGASWDGPGTVLCEQYDHQAVDTELCRVAMERGEWAFANDSVVEHLHWICGKGEKDATAEKAFANGKADIRLYRERLAKYGKKLP